MYGFETLDFSKKIFVCASGGRDSTAMALVLHEYVSSASIKSDISLFFESTGVNKISARRTLDRLSKYTGFPVIVVKPSMPPLEVLKESFIEGIPKALEAKFEKSKSYKKYFKCCTLLKKQPAEEYLKQFGPDDVILLLGFKAGDRARHRRFRLRELRDAETFYRRLTKNNRLYFYPLRDCEESDIEWILRFHGFQNTESSGCAICPVFCIADWDDKDPDTARRSKAFAKRLGVDIRAENQTAIRDFCSELPIDEETDLIVSIEKELEGAV